MTNITTLYTGIGKRKTSVAKVFLTEGEGQIIINNKSLDDFFMALGEERESLKNPFILVNLMNKYNVNVKVHGGGISAQLDAIQLGIVKAICAINIEYRQIFNQHLLLRRDSRIKERRKYGLKKARKASQYSKR
jgi:small subunit ribosomal protein S9